MAPLWLAVLQRLFAKSCLDPGAAPALSSGSPKGWPDSHGACPTPTPASVRPRASKMIASSLPPHTSRLPPIVSNVRVLASSSSFPQPQLLCLPCEFTSSVRRPDNSLALSLGAQPCHDAICQLLSLLCSERTDSPCFSLTRLHRYLRNDLDHLRTDHLT